MITPIIRLLWGLLTCLFITFILLIASIFCLLFYLKGFKSFLGIKEYQIDNISTGFLVWFEKGSWKSPIHWVLKIKT